MGFLRVPGCFLHFWSAESSPQYTKLKDCYITRGVPNKEAGQNNNPGWNKIYKLINIQGGIQNSKLQVQEDFFTKNPQNNPKNRLLCLFTKILAKKLINVQGLISASRMVNFQNMNSRPGTPIRHLRVVSCIYVSPISYEDLRYIRVAFQYSL